jgi:predicted dehydrogenase
MNLSSIHEKHRVLIIGLGRIGLQYDYDKPKDQFALTHSRAFSQHPAFELVGAVDIREENRRSFAAQYVAPAFADIESAMKTTQPAVVVLATPTAEHQRHLEQVFAWGKVRAVLCEKPISASKQSAEEMLELCARMQSTMYVNYMRRADVTVEEIKARLADGRIQGPVRGQIWYSRGLFNSASHFVNLLEYIFGEVKEVHLIAPGQLYPPQDPEPDFRLSFAEADFVFQAVRNTTIFYNAMEWLTANGRLRYEQGGAKVHWNAAHSDGVFSGYTGINEGRTEILPCDFYQVQHHVADQLAACLSGKVGKICTGEQGLQTLRTIDRIQELL